MVDNEEIRKAVWYVENLFKDKKDRAGFPYVGHLYRVAARVAVNGPPSASTLVIAALLHDVIEDTDVGPAELESKFGKEVTTLVLLLSRSVGETYMDYIQRIVDSKNADAVRLKLADLADNMDPMREGGSGTLRQRYLKAEAKLSFWRRSKYGR